LLAPIHETQTLTFPTGLTFDWRKVAALILGTSGESTASDTSPLARLMEQPLVSARSQLDELRHSLDALAHIVADAQGKE
jgi:hypothetical protein